MASNDRGFDPNTQPTNTDPSLNAAADELNNMKQMVNDEATRRRQEGDEKAGTASKEDPHERNLFDTVITAIMGILKDENTAKAFSSLNSKVGHNIADELVKLISTSVTYSVFAAIGLYDNELKDALQGDFDEIANLIRGLDSEVSLLKLKVLDSEKTVQDEKLNTDEIV